MEVEGLQCLADVSAKAAEWLWDGRVPLGELTIIEGDPATNKSSVCCALAGCLTNGVAMPHAASKGRPRKGGALFLIGEDSVEKTVVPRLRAAGADLDKVYTLDDVAIPDNLDRIEKAIREIGAKLVVVDTLDDFVNGATGNNRTVRRVLGALRDLAERTQVAIILLRHFVKKKSGKSLLRGGGSVAITGLARSQLKLYKHPDDEHLRVLVQDKSNLGPLSPSLLFKVVSAEDGQFRLECRGETDLTIADLENTKGAPKLEAAEKFLLEKLADGPKDVNWLVEHAQGTCSKRTLDEAKKNLGLATQRKGRRKDQIVSWALPAAAEPKEHSAKAASKAKKPAAKTPKAKKPQAKKAAGKKAASKKPASKTLATKTPRATSTKIRLPKASEIYIGE